MGTHTNMLMVPTDTSKNVLDYYDKDLPEAFNMLAPGDFLSVSYPHQVARGFAAYDKRPGIIVIGFDNNVAALSMLRLRDMLFAAVETDKILAILDMSCCSGYFSGRDALKALEQEQELEAMSAALKIAIVAVHDDREVDPYVAMTQPFIFDGDEERLVRNHFGVPVRYLVRRLECADDAGWFHAFNGRNTQLRLT